MCGFLSDAKSNNGNITPYQTPTGAVLTTTQPNLNNTQPPRGADASDEPPLKKQKRN